MVYIGGSVWVKLAGIEGGKFTFASESIGENVNMFCFDESKKTFY